MSKGPGLFVDIDKKTKDLLTKDYTSDQKFTVSTYTGAGVALTSTALKKGGLSTGDVAALYKYKNSQFDVKVDTDSNTIASFKVPDYNSSKLEVQYFHDHATVTTTVGLNQTPDVDVTATIGTPTITFGAEAVLKMLSEIGTVENIPEFIEGAKNRKRKMSGFGHRVYKNYDPRAKVIKNLAEEVFSLLTLRN